MNPRITRWVCFTSALLIVLVQLGSLSCHLYEAFPTICPFLLDLLLELEPCWKRPLICLKTVTRNRSVLTQIGLDWEKVDSVGILNMILCRKKCSPLWWDCRHSTILGCAGVCTAESILCIVMCMWQNGGLGVEHFIQGLSIYSSVASLTKWWALKGKSSIFHCLSFFLNT